MCLFFALSLSLSPPSNNSHRARAAHFHFGFCVCDTKETSLTISMYHALSITHHQKHTHKYIFMFPSLAFRMLRTLCIAVVLCLLSFGCYVWWLVSFFEIKFDYRTFQHQHMCFEGVCTMDSTILYMYLYIFRA